jgi:pimeloyl-ACP methyl ester carboxylesterase
MKILVAVLSGFSFILASCANPVSPSAITPTESVATVVPSATALPTATATESVSAVSGIDWQACSSTLTEDESFTCGIVQVPLDYSDVDGETIGIQVIRYPARPREGKNPIGPLLLNPGGPGGSGVEMVILGARDIQDKVGLYEFDIIGFDPRGVDGSGALACQSDAELDKYRFPDTTPDTPEEMAFLDEAKIAFEKACKEKYGEAIRFYSTENTARDMDIIRTALGAEKINFLGFSYGTYLGGVYARMFPDNVRAMVLDAAFDPAGDSVEEQYTTQLTGFNDAMENWVKWCTDKTNECGFQSTDVGARWNKLWDQYDASPVTANDGRVVNQVLIETATISALYSRSSWPQLGNGLAEAEAGDPTILLKLADNYDERDDQGQYSAINSAMPIISCASGIVRESPNDPASFVEKLKSLSPYFTKTIRVSDFSKPDSCFAWINPPATSPIGNPGNAPILVIGGENDPATPMRWAEKMVKNLGQNAQLVRYSGEGHGVIPNAKCVNRIAHVLFTDLSLPNVAVNCTPDPDVVSPSWWDKLPREEASAELLSAKDISKLLNIAPNEAYGTGFVISGDSDQLIDSLTKKFKDESFIVANKFEEFYEGRKAVYFFDEEIVSVFVFSKKDLSETDTLGISDSIPDGQTLVIYLFFP